MALPEFTMKQLLESGIQFGHRKFLWNPKMKPYIFGERSKIHIIDLSQTVPMLNRALQAVSDTVSRGGRVLFVGTKPQASDLIMKSAKRSAQYYINSKWLGGMMTNWKTVSNSIQRLRDLDKTIKNDIHVFTKKERLNIERKRDKLERALGGIRDMGGLPDLMFIVDTNREKLAIEEARRLKIPIVAVVDTNSNPDFIDYIIPGNDDSSRSIALFCDLIASAAIDGIARQQSALGGGMDLPADLIVEDEPKSVVAE
ncbi:30S ribosomal protein S2 [Candidatus Liberibacter americanus]|uniref:Small ribosomal subunit protein uS2 n=1 Tax=Candidatus Liberibacter americanus str. Sao Paulo TaxID=1261131 RepID=U6B3N5_9HYPH|nr:30S ribosomal protein S2 [Candidatus Liberibacter americanus]AHA27555.1 Ribosomal protein S2 [Candidatus Liberibacter americanus str. Sao Paulo]EMS36484.1 30S ribosomal protein S2 [Candidatus Liberibacter americanus PW_SP]